jgi:hypothetical protein
MSVLLSWVLGTKAGKLAAGAVLLVLILLALLGWKRSSEARIAEAKASAETYRAAYENQAKVSRELESKLREASRRRFVREERKPDGSTVITTSEYEESRERVDRDVRERTEPRLPESRASWSWGPMLGGGYQGGPIGFAGGAVRVLGKGPELGAWGGVMVEASNKPRATGALAGLLVTF